MQRKESKWPFYSFLTNGESLAMKQSMIETCLSLPYSSRSRMICLVSHGRTVKFIKLLSCDVTVTGLRSKTLFKQKSRIVVNVSRFVNHFVFVFGALLP